MPDKEKSYDWLNSLSIGIIGVALLGLLGIIFGPIAIYFGKRGLDKENKRTESKIGILLGIITILLWFINLIVGFVSPITPV